MANDAERPEGRKAEIHGVLFVHGAGMPEDQKTIVGDPLSTIANGLIDTFTSDDFLRQGYRLATKASEEQQNLTGLDLDIFCRAQGDQPEEKVCTLRMRDVLWKPTIRQRGLGDYIPLLWLWAMAFQSHVTRMAKLEALDRLGPANWDDDGLAILEKKSRVARRRRDLLSRVALAIAGVVSTVLFSFVAGEVAKWLNPTWTGESPAFRQVWQITTSVICVSLVSGVLLFLLAMKEYADRKHDKPHSRLHMFAIILTTAWLALFVMPLLLMIYYLPRGVTVVGIFAGAVGAILIALRIDPWWERMAFLFLIAVGIWLLTIINSKVLRTEALLHWLRTDVRSAVADWLTTLLVTAGAPLLIAFILLLELLSIVPFIGDAFQSLANRISEASQWESLKDIHMFLTDSSRAAAARCCVENAIIELANEVDSVYILSHSLGTVVAFDTLVQIGRGDGVAIKKDDVVYGKLKSLVTFGSPLNKVRTLANKTAEDQQVQADFDYTRFDNSVVLDGPAGFQWLNFYSFQDVVSDVLTLYARKTDPIRPHEFAVASANDLLTAHGGYWTDRGFWNTILQAMGVIYPASDLTRIAKLVGTKGDGHLMEDLRNQGTFTRGQLNLRVQSGLRAKLTSGVP